MLQSRVGSARARPLAPPLWEEGLHARALQQRGGRWGVGAREQRAGKVYVLSGELDGDRIIPCCKASYRTEEKLLLSLSHEGEEGRVNLRTRTRTHLQQSRTSEELTATDSH